MKKYTLTVQEDPTTGDAYIEFPEELITVLGWSDGTELVWLNNKDGTFTLKESNETDGYSFYS